MSSPIPFLLFAFWTKIFLVQLQFYRKYSKTIPKFVLAAKSIQLRKNILSPILSLTLKKFLSAYKFYILARAV